MPIDRPAPNPVQALTGQSSPPGRPQSSSRHRVHRLGPDATFGSTTESHNVTVVTERYFAAGDTDPSGGHEGGQLRRARLIQAAALNAAQKAKLLALAEVFVGNMAEGHAKAKLAEVEKHLDDTYFEWVGPTDADAVFYFKMQSPVILIEFDCQGGARPPARSSPPALVAANATATAIASGGGGQGGDSAGASRNHIHYVVRTPNGNDYGFDLLKEHLATAHATSSTG